MASRVPALVPAFRKLYVDAWLAADPGDAAAGPGLSEATRRSNERELEKFVDQLSAESRRARRRRTRQAQAEQRLLSAFGEFATATLGWDRTHLTPLLSNGFRDALGAFPGAARRFDPALPLADIYQAARNAVTMHCLQCLLGVPVATTPSVLAYSLLYPYTDNLLDDETLGAQEKAAFAQRLAARLRGQPATPASSREEKIFRLVAMIEDEHPRARREDVFDSLLAIHEAQERSVRLVAGAGPGSSRELIEIAVDKGGTSVLADGYLVAPGLTEAQAECLFGLGVFLQLRDDLEDVADDQAHHLRTVFSARDGQPLDDPTARALAIGAAVLERLACFDAPPSAAVRHLMARSLALTITDAAASYPRCYSPAFFLDLERSSPFRLASLVRQRRRLSRAGGSLSGLLETWLASSDALGA